MIKSRKIINSVEYIIEVDGKFIQERYKFVIQAYSRKGRVASYSGWTTEEFIEDEIDNSRNISYLKKITLKLAENHLEDIFRLPTHTVARNINYWLKEARGQIDKEQ